MENWKISRPLARWWKKNHPEAVARLEHLNPDDYIGNAERWGTTAVELTTWPDKRVTLLKAGAAIDHPRGVIKNLPAECASRGIRIQDIAAATGWSRDTLRYWCSGKRLTRLWDAILGTEAAKYGA